MSIRLRCRPAARASAVALSLAAAGLWPSHPVRSQEAPPPTSLPVERTWEDFAFTDGRGARPLANFRLRMRYRTDDPRAALGGAQDAAGPWPLPSGEHLLEWLVEDRPGVAFRQEWLLDGQPVKAAPGTRPAVGGETGANLSWSGDFTVAVHLETTGDGTLISRCAPQGKWTPNAKALFLRDGRLVYDIGWLGAFEGPRVSNGKPHRVLLRVKNGEASFALDGRPAGSRRNFTRPDNEGDVVKVGRAAEDFGHAFEGGTLHNVRFWTRALEGAEWTALTQGRWDEVNSPDLNWKPEPLVETFSGRGAPGRPRDLRLTGDVRVLEAAVQALEPVDHAALARAAERGDLPGGEAIYTGLCVTCHGTDQQEGSLPTALRFHAGVFRNGNDPYRMFQTLTRGYGQMVPQPQYTAEQLYAVIHHIREQRVRPRNPAQYAAVTPAYLDLLPRGLTPSPAAAVATRKEPPYERMDFGPYLFWTYQVNPGAPIPRANIAQKGLAVRLDPGPGGVSRGNTWMVYDHDTLRVAAGWTGRFVDWKGIAFDGSHGTHTSIGADPVFTNPVGPGWAHPVSGSWADPRPLSRDGRPYGPLDRTWVQYRGLFRSGDRVAVDYTVGTRRVLDAPGAVSYGGATAFIRSLQVHAGDRPLRMRAAPVEGLRVVVTGAGTVRAEEGFHVVEIPASPGALLVRVAVMRAEAEPSLAPVLAATPLTDPGTITQGAAPVEPAVTTRGVVGEDTGAFAVDVLTVPNLEANPSQSWMRLGGFDFDPRNPDLAYVCTWNGDVWRVDGVAGGLEQLAWRRIASGLFQPLGLKVVGGIVHVTCRDQIVQLRDFNGDGVADVLACFNNDHQVTEHFHEFAMGLQADGEGNLYYAKSARHALPALVPHHGTLLRVSADGSRTDILATGFRAANGVCLNPDQTFFVTDQEGHWTPKNRINLVRPGGFYGNMFGFHDITDASDAAMQEPLCWITNEFDRSPSELVWVPQTSAWTALRGSLLNLSYGYGKIFTVPHEIVEGRAQGAMCALPIPDLPTGVHRARFHPVNGQLYLAGMFAWAGNRTEDGGFFRVRQVGAVPAALPVEFHGRAGVLRVAFSDPLDASSVRPDAFAVRAWDLQRSASYGSKHLRERAWPVTEAALEPDGRTVRLAIPELQATRGLSVQCRLRDSGGRPVERLLHGSLYVLP